MPQVYKISTGWDRPTGLMDWLSMNTVMHCSLPTVAGDSLKSDIFLVEKLFGHCFRILQFLTGTLKVMLFKLKHYFPGRAGAERLTFFRSNVHCCSITKTIHI